MFKKNKNPKIIFTNFMGWHESTKPVPASKKIPEWYKETANRHPLKRHPNSIPTIKRCMPVFDSMTAGYILSTPCDVFIETKKDEPSYSSSMPEVIASHPAQQLHLHPKANGFEAPKWINSWAIKTPKGYSVLIVPPLHNDNPWFEILPGIVDTDTYTAPINFPFLLKDTSFEGVIPAQTPLAQIIPFKREEWEMQIGNEEDLLQANDKNKELSSKIFDRYKSLFWHKKSFN